MHPPIPLGPTQSARGLRRLRSPARAHMTRAPDRGVALGIEREMAKSVSRVRPVSHHAAQDTIDFGGVGLLIIAPQRYRDARRLGPHGPVVGIGGHRSRLLIAPVCQILLKRRHRAISNRRSRRRIGCGDGRDGLGQRPGNLPTHQLHAVDEDHRRLEKSQGHGLFDVPLHEVERLSALHDRLELGRVVPELDQLAGQIEIGEAALMVKQPLVHLPEAVVSVENARRFRRPSRPARVRMHVSRRMAIASRAERELLGRQRDVVSP